MIVARTEQSTDVYLRGLISISVLSFSLRRLDCQIGTLLHLQSNFRPVHVRGGEGGEEGVTSLSAPQFRLLPAGDKNGVVFAAGLCSGIALFLQLEASPDLGHSDRAGGRAGGGWLCVLSWTHHPMRWCNKNAADAGHRQRRRQARRREGSAG